MTFSCQACNRRKIRCDKVQPECSSCRKSRIDCRYIDPNIARNLKRRYHDDDDLKERLDRCEALLLQHGLLPREQASTTVDQARVSDTVPTDQPVASGSLVSAGTQTRYVESSLWRSLGPETYQSLASEGTLLGETQTEIDAPILDPLSASFLQATKFSLLHLHPTIEHARILWMSYLENCEPLCKLLHVPSATCTAETAYSDPSRTTASQECLLFAVYHFAVFSMTDDFCNEELGQSKPVLLQTFSLACRQALLNADWLRTTDLMVLQALLLYLLPSRYTCDPNTFWILCGTAVRIAQRMGLHKEVTHDISPFDVQMRRRVSFQLILLDGIASRMVGCGMGMLPSIWETQPPMNINDDQMWPDMTTEPSNSGAATDMIYCLIRADIVKALSNMHKSVAIDQYPSNIAAMDEYVAKAESMLETKYVRYCDATNPLHFLAMCLVRAAASHMRLRARLPVLPNQEVPQALKKEAFDLSMKILDTDSAASAHTGLARFRWHIGSFFLYGSWDSLLFVLNSLARGDVGPLDIDPAWTRLEQIYHDRRAELLDSKQAFHLAIGRLTLKAWEATRHAQQQPMFVQELSVMADARLRSASMPAIDPSIEQTGVHDLDLDSIDWLFWDRMIKDYQTQNA